MRNRVIGVLKHRLQVWRIGVPLWVVLSGLVFVVAGAGQAVGPVISGSVNGLVGLVVEQTVVLSGVEWRDYPPALVYSISPRDDQLRVVDTSTVVETTSTVTITLVGKTVEGGNGLAADPTDSDKLYALLKLQGQAGRELVTIDPTTGVATSVGDTGDRFAGLAFTSAGVLYGVTGDGAVTPETLYTLSKITGAKTSVLTLGNGNDGETMAFNPDDGLIYHASGEGIPNVNEIFETIDPVTLAVTSITLKGQDYAEATAMAYEGNSNFFLADLGRRLYRINTDGVSELIGIIDHDTKGLVPFDLAHVDDALALINDEGTSFTAALEPHVGDSFMLIFDLENESDADANATLELEVPDGIHIEVQAVGSIEEAQLTETVWILKVPSTLTEGKLRVIFETTDDYEPGFYTVKGRIVQVTG